MPDTQTQTGNPTATGNPQNLTSPSVNPPTASPQTGTALNDQNLPQASSLKVTSSCDQLCSVSTSIPAQAPDKPKAGFSLGWLLPAIIIAGCLIVTVKLFSHPKP